MAGYVIIIRDEITDPEGYAAALERYTVHASQSPLEKIDVLAARDTKFEVVEGDPALNIAILRFPEYADALAWYNSEAYQRAVAIRSTVAKFRAFVVEAKQ